MLVNCKYGRFAQRAHSLYLTQKTFAEILAAASEQELVTAAQNAGKSAPIAMISSKSGEVTVNSVAPTFKVFVRYDPNIISLESIRSSLDQ